MSDPSAGAEPSHRMFVSYIDKSRDFYAAQGYERPYRWAYNRSAPFTPLSRPLATSRIGLVTTALDDPRLGAADSENLPVEATYAASTEPPPSRLFTSHRAWDKAATHTEDLDSYFPINRLRELAESGRIGGLSPRFYGIPTEYSQRRTNDVDVPTLLEYMRHDGVDVAMLVPL